MRRRARRWGIPALAAAGLLFASEAIPQDVFRPQDFATTATFQLVVQRSTVLKLGTSTIVAQSALASRLHRLMPGNSEGLEILFFSQPITDGSRVDLLEHHAQQMKKRDFAGFVLFLDKQSKVWQVNLSYVIPGTTAGRTVAWKPEDLAQFSSFRFAGKRVLLKSKGLYRDTASEAEQLSLSWDIDVSLPVLDPVTR